MSNTPFLTHLPVEIRIQIYAYILPSGIRLKLRQHVPGPFNLSLLRVCRQTHEEALQVLYERNVIVATRNDFCQLASPGLQTLLQTDCIRHLYIAVFNRSITCSLVEQEDERCGVCQMHAFGLIKTLLAMPRLRTAVVSYSLTQYLKLALKERLQHDNTLGLELQTALDGSGFRLTGPMVQGKDISFVAATV